MRYDLFTRNKLTKTKEQSKISLYMEIEKEINNYFNLFGWNSKEISRIVSVLPSNWSYLDEEIKNKYLSYVNSPEFTLKKLREII